jgi:hypothetical protein
MRKIRLILLSAAVLIAAGGVMATARPKAACDSLVQYYKYEDKFYVAGEYGVDFVCAWDHWGTCTYYYDAASGTYRDCRAGKILWLR